MPAYYNENDAFAAAWLRNLITAGLIAAGDVDERDIADVGPGDLEGYTQCHFFAGIGGWSYALRLAGWPDDRPVWTGSCPCQPFSAAGSGKAADDRRHLWPQWFPLIAQCRPAIVLGEQVEAAIGWGWLDVVFADLEAAGYACGASVLPACSVGAPHIRNRVWFVADALRSRAGYPSGQGMGTKTAADGADRHLSRQRLRPGIESPAGDVADAECGARQLDRQQVAGAPRSAEREGLQRQRVRPELGDGITTGGLADAKSNGRRTRRTAGQGGRNARSGPDGLCADSTMVDADCAEQQERRRAKPVGAQFAGARCAGRRPWDHSVLIRCSDGNWRSVPANPAWEPEPALFPLAHGIPNRVGTLRGAGNAIVPQIAAEFIRAALP